jgi:hypothetical protein
MQRRPARRGALPARNTATGVSIPALDDESASNVSPSPANDGADQAGVRLYNERLISLISTRPSSDQAEIVRKP